MIARAVVLVMDGFGVGAAQDAAQYGDAGANTLEGIARAMGGLELPNLERLGLGRLGRMRAADARTPARGRMDGEPAPQGCFGKMAERSAGKDTTTGHWEMMGLVVERPFPTYPNGFPRPLLEAYEKAIGRTTLGNLPASGTEIIARLGEEHMKTGSPIVYTSADSVFQVAAHEEVIPVPELYRLCRAARDLLVGEHAVGRVIARPFVGRPGAFTRTYNRKDFTVKPFGETALDRLKCAGLPVVGIGKIGDIFSGQGLTDSIHTEGNAHGMEETVRCLSREGSGLIFTNLVDFDMVYGHRNDVKGYARALAKFDRELPEVLMRMTREDVLFITADHGNDPTTPGTDHTREQVPLLVYGPAARSGASLGTRATFADLGQTLVDLFHLEPLACGTSFSKDVGLS